MPLEIFLKMSPERKAVDAGFTDDRMCDVEQQGNIISSNNYDRNKDVPKSGSPEKKVAELLYKVQDSPTFLVTIVLGIQIAVINISISVTEAVIIGGVLCADSETSTQLIGSTIFMTGIGTVLQVMFGVRLPMVHCANFAFLVPILNMGKRPEWRCPDNLISANGNWTEGPGTLGAVNATMEVLSTQDRISLFQGSLLAASAVHVVIGASGIVGYVSRFIGPLTIAPTISLIGVVIIDSAIELSSTHWGIAILTFATVVIMTSYLESLTVPFPAWTKDKGLYMTSYPVFRVYAVIFGVLIGCLLSFLLTHFQVLTDNPDNRQFRARMDARSGAITTATWFYFPYPGQFGDSSFSLGIFVGFLTCVIITIIESLGNSIVASRICDEAPPPPHAVNRGMLVTGLCSALSGSLGVAHATLPSSSMVSIISLTKVGSRLVFLSGGLVLILMAVVGKFSAVFLSVPDPVFGGLTMVTISTLAGIGLASMQTVDLSLSRNYITLGLSFILGILVPRWVQDHPEDMTTGLDELDQFILALLGNAPFMGGLVGFFLDLTLPGNRSSFAQEEQTGGDVTKKRIDNDNSTIYDFQWIPARFCSGKWTTFVPFIPSYYDNRER